MNNEQLNKEIEATMNSLDNMSRAEVSPYFYTRLEGRLEQQHISQFDAFLQMLCKPAVAVSMLSVFLLLNIMAIKGLNATNDSAPKSASLQNFAAEFNLNTTSVYTNTER